MKMSGYEMQIVPGWNDSACQQQQKRPKTINRAFHPEVGVSGYAPVISCVHCSVGVPGAQRGTSYSPGTREATSNTIRGRTVNHFALVTAVLPVSPAMLHVMSKA